MNIDVVLVSCDLYIYIYMNVFVEIVKLWNKTSNMLCNL